MQAREWFLDKPGTNAYDIEVHVQRSFWHNGFGEAFFRCTKAEPPYRCEGFWRGQEIAFEWVPRQWLTLYLQEYDEGLVEGVSGVMRFAPSIQYALAVSQDGSAPEGAGDSESDAAAAEGGSGGAAGDDQVESESQEQVVVEWRVRGVDERMRELIEQDGVSGVRQLA
ncbi:MAG: hypothetical protein MAG451_02431 [Anaerolineales bacterium]|nr:hypothetical protein [Anaerolineales bacterium]